MALAKPDRRTFLRWLLATPIAATLDVEQLLWVPKPIIVVPAMPAPWVLHLSQNAKYSFGFTGFQLEDLERVASVLVPRPALIDQPQMLRLVRQLSTERKQALR